MMTMIVLFLIGAVGLAYACLPLWQGKYRPWLLDAPSRDVEALQQEQAAALGALRDLATDFKMGALAEQDYHALAAPLQQRAKRAMQLQEGAANGGDVDAELDALLEEQILAARHQVMTTRAPGVEQIRYCPQCGAAAADGYRFCAVCGVKLPVQSVRQVEVQQGAERLNGGQEGQPRRSEPTAAVAAEAIAEAPATNAGADPSATAVVDAMPGTGRRWLWIVGGLVGVAWIVAVAWLYLDSRAGQQAQTPVATLPNVQIQSLAAADGLLVMGASKGVNVSTDGVTWTPLPVAGDIRAVARSNGDGVWLAVGPDRLWRSEDGGRTWGPLLTSPPDLSLVTLAATPGQSGLLWATDATSLYTSQDSGRTWALASSELPGAPRALAAGATDLFIGSDRGVFRSTDGGQSWMNYNGSVNGAIASTDVQAMAYDEANGMLYAGTSRGLSFQKLDAPGSWGQRSLQADVSALALDGENNQILWVGAANGALYGSADRGVTWE